MKRTDRVDLMRLHILNSRLIYKINQHFASFLFVCFEIGGYINHFHELKKIQKIIATEKFKNKLKR